MKYSFKSLVIILVLSVFSIPSIAIELPIFLTVTTQYCDTCKKLKPIIEELEYEYSGKVEFITLEVGSKQAISESEQIAMQNGIEEYFNKYKNHIPQVGLLCPNGLKENKTFIGEIRKEKYIKAIDTLLEDQGCSGI